MVGKGARNAEIEKLYREGASYAELARQFDLSPSRVSQIVANRGAHAQQARNRFECAAAAYDLSFFASRLLIFLNEHSLNSAPVNLPAHGHRVHELIPDRVYS